MIRATNVKCFALALAALLLCSVGGAPAAAQPPVESPWMSGAAGRGVVDGTFSQWRGEPVTVARTWSDRDEAQLCVASLSGFSDWQGALDLAPGGLLTDQTFEQAAAGALDTQWIGQFEAMQAWLAADPTRTLYVSPFHEMNGDWMPWSVTRANLGAFHAGWARYHDLLERLVPQARLVLDVNLVSTSDVSLEELWPGYVDVLGISAYTDHFPDDESDPQWSEGLDALMAFAQLHGVQVAVSEWGRKGVDDAQFIERMHEWFAASAGPGPGQLLYETVFNIDAGGASRVDVEGTETATAYEALNWGRAVIG